MANKNFIQKQWNGTGYDELYPKTTPAQAGLGNVDNVQQMPLSYLDTDGTLASDSDVKVPSQKAVKTAIATAIGTVASGLLYKGTFDASAESFTALADASQGDFYKVSVAGTVSGVDFQVGDMIIVNKDVTGTPVVADVDKVDNTEASDILRTGDIGVNVASYGHNHDLAYEPKNENIQAHIIDTTNPHSVTKTQVGLGNVTDDAQLKIASNLSDLNDVATARTNLGLGDSATKNVGTTSGTVAAGDDSRIVNAVPNTRTVNGKALNADVTLSASDIGTAQITVSATASAPSNPSIGDVWFEIV